MPNFPTNYILITYLYVAVRVNIYYTSLDKPDFLMALETSPAKENKKNTFILISHFNFFKLVKIIDFTSLNVCLTFTEHTWCLFYSTEDPATSQSVKTETYR